MDNLYRGLASSCMGEGLLASQVPCFMQLVVSNDFDNLKY